MKRVCWIEEDILVYSEIWGYVEELEPITVFYVDFLIGRMSVFVNLENLYFHGDINPLLGKF